VKSNSTVLTPGSEIIAPKYPESQKVGGGGLIALTKKRILLKDWCKYVLPNIVFKVNELVIYSVLQKELRHFSSRLHPYAFHGTTCNVLCI